MNINEDIVQIKERNPFRTWEEIAIIVNYNHDAELTGNACRKRYENNRPPTVASTVYKRHNYKNNVPWNIKGDYMIIPDTHLPFMLEGGLEFLVRTKEKYNIKEENILHIGDYADLHAINYHDHDPDGFSSGNELEVVRESTEDFAREFPKLKLTIGNHDSLPLRKAVTHGISRQFMAEFNEVYNTPDTWEWNYSYLINEATLARHGCATGVTATLTTVISMNMNVIEGHTHSYASIIYRNNGMKTSWGMNVGTLADIEAYGMLYANAYKNKHTYACGLVLDNCPHIEPYNGK